MKGLWLLAIVFALPPWADAQVRAELSAVPLSAPALVGTKFFARVSVAVERDWHIGSLTQSEETTARTGLALPPDQPVRQDGAIIAPKPRVGFDAQGRRIEYFADQVVFIVPLVTTADLTKEFRLVVEFSYQACSEQTCLRPTKEKLTALISTGN